MELQARGLPFGHQSEVAYHKVSVGLSPGDCVVLCSDGVMEAKNSQGERFGFVRTSEAVRKVRAGGVSAEETVSGILSSVETFLGDVSRADDMTCVVLCVEKPRDVG